MHRIGLEEVARIESRMAEVRRSLAWSGTAAEFRESLRRDPRFRAKTPDEVGSRLMAYDARIRAAARRLLRRAPEGRTTA